MASVTLGGNPVALHGDLPAVGAAAPDFTLTNSDLGDVSLKDFAGKKIILNIFPSIDTPTCATAVKKFNTEADALDNTVVLCVSADLPFALSRFCGAEKLESVTPLSSMRGKGFGKAYGVLITDGPLAGVFTRAIVVVGTDGNVVYTQLVSEIKDEPDYDAALAAVKS